MQLDDRLGEVEAEAGAADAERARVAGPREAAEELRALALRDADAAVAHDELDGTRTAAHRDLDGLAAR